MSRIKVDSFLDSVNSNCFLDNRMEYRTYPRTEIPATVYRLISTASIPLATRVKMTWSKAVQDLGYVYNEKRIAYMVVTAFSSFALSYYQQDA